MSLIVWGYDAARLGTIGFTLTETGGGGASGAVSLTAQYTHSNAEPLSAVTIEDPQTGEVSTTDLGYRSLGLALKAAMDAIGNATYTVTFNVSGTYTISASGGGVTSFAISSITTPARRLLGHDNESGALSYVSARSIWHFNNAATGGFSEWQESEGEIGGDALVGADGSVRGLVGVGATRLLDFVVPLEPMASVWTDMAATADDWTWQRAFQRCRTIEPIAVLDPRDATQTLIGYLRHDAAVMRPRLMSADYLAYQSVPIGMHVIGRV